MGASYYCKMGISYYRKMGVSYYCKMDTSYYCRMGTGYTVSSCSSFMRMPMLNRLAMNSSNRPRIR